MIEISSNERANTALIKPPNENKIDVPSTVKIVTNKCSIPKSVKNSATIETIKAITSPRKIPPLT